MTKAAREPKSLNSYSSKHDQVSRLWTDFKNSRDAHSLEAKNGECKIVRPNALR